MRAQHAPQSFVQQMRCAMVRPHMAAPHIIYTLINRCALSQRAGCHLTRQNMQIAQFFARIRDVYFQPIVTGHNTRIADLTAAFGIKRGLVYDEVNLLTGRSRVDQFAIGTNGLHHAFGLGRRIADKFCGSMRVAQIEPDSFGGFFAGARPVGARLSTLFFHGRIKTTCINRQPALA